ncbi:hypothetical protein EV421DRAFT_1913392 [Armillaria borealis]|uniref:Uncharacterized protein n=1 Tax=Armillaria borealis TaxID=47425 RepID=A0AA39IVT5_9AGAR|nr:hypothetical protein EV421DRAFT_1913392 [Armillaria borealis]
MVMYSHNPQVLPDSPLSRVFTTPAASEFSKAMAKIHKQAETALEEAARRMKKQDRVWLDATNLHLPCPKKKLDDKLPPHWKIHPRFNEKLLMPYIPPAFPNQEQPPPPPPDLIKDEEQWEIEEWKEWTREHNLWVPETEMGNAQEAITNYKKKIQHAGWVDIAKIATNPDHALAMIIDHEYLDNGDTIITKLLASLQDPSFNGWELWMSEWSGHTKIKEDTLLLATFLSNLSNPKGHKCLTSLVDESGDNNASGDNDNEEQGDTTSGDEGTDDESEKELGESEEEILPKICTPKPKTQSPGKAASTSSTTSLATGAFKNQKQKASSPKKKFTTPKESKAGHLW